MHHDDLGAGKCPYPAYPGSGQTPDHLYNFEWTDHFVKEHATGLPSVEALYRAVWKLYTENPDLVLPVEGLQLPVLYK